MILVSPEPQIRSQTTAMLEVFIFKHLQLNSSFCKGLAASNKPLITTMRPVAPLSQLLFTHSKPKHSPPPRKYEHVVPKQKHSMTSHQYSITSCVTSKKKWGNAEKTVYRDTHCIYLTLHERKFHIWQIPTFTYLQARLHNFLSPAASGTWKWDFLTPTGTSPQKRGREVHSLAGA
jgi:hypothetical protein